MATQGKLQKMTNQRITPILYGPPTPAGVTMNQATFARSVSGRKKLANDFSSDIENLIKILNGDKYAALKKVVNQNWTGTDATDFLNDIEKTRKSLETKLRALKNQFNSAISSDASQFAKFQSKNVK